MSKNGRNGAQHHHKPDPVTRKEWVAFISGFLWILHDLYKIFSGGK